MPLDHFIPQVHLRNFYSTKLKGQFFAVKKSDLKSFAGSSKDVCRIENGSTNPFLLEPRVVEEVLTTIEPRYNSAVQNLSNRNIDADTIYVLGGYAAYLLICSPTAARLSARMLESSVMSVAEIAERKGDIEPPPAELGGNSLAELLQKGVVKIDVDPDYPKAMGITQMFNVINSFGNSHWEVLMSRESDSTFFTSDFPVAIEKSRDLRIDHRVFPMLPHLAVRIMPDISSNEDRKPLDFSNFRVTRRWVEQAEISRINRTLVQCAESMVFYSDDPHWLVPFVRKNRDYRVETVVKRIATETGYVHWNSQRVVQFRR